MRTFLSLMISYYEYLLRLYPRSYREDFAEEMLADFSDLATEANEKGRLALLWFCFRELVDFPGSIIQIHLKYSRALKILRSRPVDTGWRSALGFGVAFGLVLPTLRLVSQNLLPWLDPIVTSLQVSYYDLFHAEQEFRLISWMPSALSSLFVGLVLGVSFAILFADRLKYSRYILAGMLGWFFYHATRDVLTIFFDFGRFLDGIQFTIFNYALMALSGAIFSLIFVVAKSEQSGSLRLFAISAFLYPLLTSLFTGGLFELFVFRTPWRFVCTLVLMVALVFSVFVLARKVDGGRRIPMIIITGAVGYPVLLMMAHFVAGQISSHLNLADTFNSYNSGSWQRVFMFTIEQAIYGTLFGLFIGIVWGLQKQSNPPQIAA